MPFHFTFCLVSSIFVIKIQIGPEDALFQHIPGSSFSSFVHHEFFSCFFLQEQNLLNTLIQFTEFSAYPKHIHGTLTILG